MKNIVYVMRLLLALLLFLPSVMAWSQDDDLLEPDKAFALQDPVVSADKITLTWKVASGYYLYQNKFSFELSADSSRLDKPQMPESIRKQDEFFGEVEIYKKSVSVDLPLLRDGSDAESVVLTAVFQGCNDPIGVCYPPINKKLKIDLPAVISTANAADLQPVASSSPTTQSGLASLLAPGAGEGEFLPPDEAFQLSVKMVSDNKVALSVMIAEGYYLYREKFAFESATEGISILPYELPAGDIKEDEFLGRTEVYHSSFAINLALSGLSADGKFKLVAKYQGCAEKGICYPPISKTIDLVPGKADGTTPAVAGGAGEKTSMPENPSSVANGEISEEQTVIAMLSEGSIGSTILAFFLFGLALSLTPCVFPMIPILSGIIVGQGTEITRKKSFTLSVVYVLGMTIMYTIAGMLAGLTGELLSSAFQNPWVLGGSALVFVLLSFSMFGFYDLQLPASLQTRLTEKSNNIPGGAYSGVFVMGALSALIVGPCVAAPLSGALLYIGQTGDFMLGGVALFVMSLGMGVPLLLIGASAGSLLPKAGAWMNAVKAVFGVLMLAVAIWLLERILPSAVILALWAALLIISAIYMRALDTLPEIASGWQRFWKGTGIVVLLYGIALLFGSLTGATDVFNPLEKMTGSTQFVSVNGSTSQAEGGLSFEEVKGIEEFDQALASAASAGKPVFVDFYADWCVECVRMENTTFKSPSVITALAGYQLLRLDLTANDEIDKQVLKKFSLFGPPALLFFGTDGQEIRHMRVIGYQDAAEFTATVEKASKAAGVK
ncbi:MAG: protein-disulfide reductase DsbD [Gammaproteobacteria bacterium]|nr:protein-disulfide reductase DsbD [Gammaproteobacteria bacterium]MDX2488515.1 protein-disulfide reductase DsbD [Gammaproteobacteria bacterium]